MKSKLLKDWKHMRPNDRVVYKFAIMKEQKMDK